MVAFLILRIIQLHSMFSTFISLRLIPEQRDIPCNIVLSPVYLCPQLQNKMSDWSGKWWKKLKINIEILGVQKNQNSAFKFI
ncbi:hypothetical protein CG709_04285 [Lachnotalea glycerini]|nr:hypothetical protein CG709_04285 [Lachnotalea glycerini]